MSSPLLFDDAHVPRRLAMVGGDVTLQDVADLGVDATCLLRELIAETRWRQETVVVWGKRHLQPRLVAWHGDDNKSYSYSGIQLNPLPWTATLLKVRDAVERNTAESFNSVLLNYYRDGRDSMGFHSDDEPELGPEPTIASVSLGAARVLIFKHKRDATVKPVRLLLSHGSLLTMKGRTQADWVHGIPKETKPIGPRVNLTFRRVLSK
jgi:alkylated DNA repair dioxygenase AlkB